MKSAAAPAVAEVLNITEDSAPLEESKIQDDHIFAMVESVPALQKINNPIEFRENFAETAFFYPAGRQRHPHPIGQLHDARKQHDLETATVSTDGRPEIRLPVPRDHHQ